MSSINNPAARLLGILKAGKELKSTTSCRTAWGTLLAVDPNNQTELIYRLGLAMALPKEIADLVAESNPTQIETMSHWVSKVAQGFAAQNLGDQWHTFANHIDDTTISLLSLTSGLLEKDSRPRIFDAEQMLTLKEQIAALIGEVVSSNLDRIVKGYMVRTLRKLLEVLDTVAICGEEPIIREINSAFGEAAITPTLRPISHHDPVSEKFWKLLGKIATIVTLASGLLQLPGDAHSPAFALEVVESIRPKAETDNNAVSDPSRSRRLPAPSDQ